MYGIKTISYLCCYEYLYIMSDYNELNRTYFVSLSGAI